LGALFEADSRLVKALDQQLKDQCGIPLIWYEVLLRVGRTGADGMTMGQLANLIALTTGGVTRLVDRAEAAGYVLRTPSPHDRRVLMLVLTAQGWQKLTEATPIHIQGIEEQLIARLEPKEVQCLFSLLEKIKAKSASGSETNNQ
jgi:DNA-binding MarR family transcriptional regulator